MSLKLSFTIYFYNPFFTGIDLDIPEEKAEGDQEEGRPLPGYGQGQTEAKARVEALLTGLEVESSGYRLGNTQVKFISFLHFHLYVGQTQ